MEEDEKQHPKVAGDDLSDEAMGQLRERMAEQPEIDRRSDELAANAAHPDEQDRRDREVPGVGGIADDYAEQGERR